MINYSVSKTHIADSVKRIRGLDGYTFKPKNNVDSLNVSEVTIVDDSLIDTILTIKFDKQFKKVVRIALKVINDDDADDSDTQFVLDEVELVREILLNKYQKYISKQKEVLFLKKLRLIENEMRLKQVAIKQKAIFLEQEKSKGRGR
jgi:hypothetical protein